MITRCPYSLLISDITYIEQSVEADVKPSLWYNYTAGLYFVSANVSNPRLVTQSLLKTTIQIFFFLRINVSLAKSNIGNFNVS